MLNHNSELPQMALPTQDRIPVQQADLRPRRHARQLLQLNYSNHPPVGTHLEVQRQLVGEECFRPQSMSLIQMTSS